MIHVFDRGDALAQMRGRAILIGKYEREADIAAYLKIGQKYAALQLRQDEAQRSPAQRAIMARANGRISKSFKIGWY